MFYVRVREEYRFFDQEEPVVFDTNMSMNIFQLLEWATTYKFLKSLCMWIGSNSEPIEFKFNPDFEMAEISEQRTIFWIKRIKKDAKSQKAIAVES